MTMRFKLFAGLVLAAGFVAGLVVSGRMSLSQSGFAEADTAVQVPVPSRPGMPSTAPLPDLSSIAERALKVSVNISSTSVTVVDDPMTRFFNGGRDVAQRSQSLGSGVVVSPEGYILTNTHVIGNNRADVRVTLADSKELPAKIIGLDDITDLAVIKIEGKDLPTLPWGDSAKLRVAEWVLAVGNPFNLAGTVTLGIVSTISRSGSQVGSFGDLIQTDAAINKGNSGGALVNSRGELVGINSMIYSETGGNNGIGFAIPSNAARDIMQQLIQHGEVRYGSIGTVYLEPIDRPTARYNRLGDVEGLVVDRLARNSSAYLAGLRPIDIIVSVNGQKTTDPNQLNRLIVGLPVGSKAKFEIVRNGRPMSIEVPVVAR
jgi:S1-C subfamily serine protease